MSNSITHENAPNHIQKLYHYVGIIAKNHNKIVDHLKDIHRNVKNLHENVQAIKNTIQEKDSTKSPSKSYHPYQSQK